MTITIMYLTVAFLLAALAMSTYVRVRGLEFAHGASPVSTAAILLVVALIIDLGAQLAISTQGWLTAEAQWKKGSPGMMLWKIGLAAQGIAVVFLVIGIWRLFAAVGRIVPGKARGARTGAPLTSMFGSEGADTAE
ncbi:MAG TPA: hypothetical protein VHE35_36875 [Kofleriaceae bacterium]|nr:hypothetical protein [Kofleriaceae bacterium]